MHRELSYFQPRNCYKKKRDGTVYYVGKGSERDSDENYKRAWGEWEVKLSDLVAKEQAQRQVQGLPKIMEMNRAERLPDAATRDAAGFPLTGDVAAIINQQTGSITLTPDQLKTMLDSARILPKAAQDGTRTVGEMVKKFIDGKRQQARTAQRSVGRFANVESYANQFAKFVGESKPIAALDAITLNEFHQLQLKAMEAGTDTAWAARDRMQVARQFIRWCFEAGCIDLPRNIDSKNLTITCTPGEIKPMPVDALQVRVKAAKERLKVELLLMANCGFYQVDAADLKHSEVDWKAGTIKRKRSKTKGTASAPVVTYYLWPTTLNQLRLLRNDDGPLVLSTRLGNATVRDSVGPGDTGKANRTDSTAQAYARLQKKIGGQAFQLKSIRKTAATLIGNSKFSRFAQYFLGQAPENVADAHYVRPGEAEFKECCEWLGKEMGLDTDAGIGIEAK